MKVKIDYKSRPKGAKVVVPNLGEFENGSTNEVDDSRWQRFVRRHPEYEQYKTSVTLPKVSVVELADTDSASGSDNEGS